MAEQDDQGNTSDEETVGYVVWMAHDPTIDPYADLPYLINMDDSDSDSDNGALAGDMVLRATADVWYFDSGATIHVARDKQHFSDYRATPGATICGVGNVPVKKAGEGTVKLTTFVGNQQTIITLNKVAHIPDTGTNLISIKCITNTGTTVDFTCTHVTV